jgi:16S rRNA (guanine1207-N2)-methyltransferase
MNPPFHDGGAEDKALGVAFIQAAAGMLHKGGTAWIVANRHLPYEHALAAAFADVAVKADAGGYKIFEARK